jgi:hypothetical protein
MCDVQMRNCGCADVLVSLTLLTLHAAFGENSCIRFFKLEGERSHLSNGTRARIFLSFHDVKFRVSTFSPIRHTLILKL